MNKYICYGKSKFFLTSLFSFREKISLFLAVWERSYLLYNTYIKNVFLPFSTQVVANAID